MNKKILLYGLIHLLIINAFGQVEGDVVDQKDIAITNSVIIATDSTGKIVDTAKTDQRGFYFFKGLKPGKYKIEAKAPGFLPAVLMIRVNPNPDNSNDEDDTYYAETLDIILVRPKAPK